MADKSESGSNSGDEVDCTIAQRDSVLEALHKQIGILQKSLAASEQEKLLLTEKMNRQSADDNAAEASAASFKSVEATIFSPIIASHSTAVVSNCYESNMGMASAATSTAPASADGIVSVAGVNYANIANVSYPTYGNFAKNHFLTQPTQNCTTTRQITNPPTINRNAAISTASAPNMSQVFMPHVSTAPIVSAANPDWSSGRYPQIQTRKILDLPEFHGTPEEWPMFSVAFKETTNLYSYTNLENLLRLQKALKGNARQQVESLLIHPNSVYDAMKTLEFHYGRPELLIRSQIAKARSFAPVSGGRIAEILNFSAMVSNLTAFLENSGATPHLNNPTLLDELVCKLPMNKREEWYRHIFNLQMPYPTVRDFCNWLQQIATYVAMSTDIAFPRNPANEQVSYKAKHSPKQIATAINIEKMCSMCKQNHQLYQCQKFKDTDYAGRWDFVKVNRLCFCCLEPGHNMQKCNKRRPCNILSCIKFHNRLLHKGNEDKKGNTVAEITSVATVSDCQTIPQHSAKQSKQRSRTLLKYVPVKLKGPKGELNVIAFIDEGAKVSLLEERVANAIGLKGKADMLRLKWIGNHTTSEHSRQVSLEVAGDFDAAEFHHIRGVRTTKQLLLPQQTLKLREFTQQHLELKDIYISDYSNAAPQILIGLPHSNLTRTIEAVNFDDGFAVHKTNLGWTVFGSNEECDGDGNICHVDIDMCKTLEMNEQIAEYFAAENFEIKQLPTIKSNVDKRAQKLLEDTTKFISGRYETGLLWRSEEIKFPESFSMAEKRLEKVEARMARDDEYAEFYNNKIKEYVEKGYARKLSPLEANFEDQRTWYLPHFVTHNPNKGNKRRVVFDAAANVNNTSLNSALMKGPEEYQPKPLLSIMLKFRQGKIAVCGDIREMFHRILIRQEDRNSQRFLWRGGDRFKQPDVYVMCAMIFGSVSSPCSAQFIKNLNAEKYRDSYPRAVNAIIDRHYVDDYMDSFNSTEEGISITKQVIDIHSSAGFELRGIVSNSKELMQAAKNDPKTYLPQLHNPWRHDCATEKVLGMHWNPADDEFLFKLTFTKVPKPVLDGTRRPTKSEVLSVMMSIFDPLGFLCNLTLPAKILMQRLWQRKVDWHDAIPGDIYEKWMKWYNSLGYIERFKIPRCYSPSFLNADANVQLHIFVDASELAYSAVAFWRMRYEAATEVSFIAGRSRCSPLKPISIPRLELQSAVLGVRLKETIVRSHDTKPRSVTFWSDSKTVIQWIRSDARRYKQYVAHRIAEVLESSDTSQWRWLPSQDNPADDATRIKTFTLNGKWLNGPSFLKLPESNWPAMPKDVKSTDQDVEERPKQLYTIHEEGTLPFRRYSNYAYFIKIMSWVKLAIKKFRERNFTVPTRVNVIETKNTELLICHLVQETAFFEEFKCLQSASPIDKRSPLYKLSPMLDEEGVMRLGGRIDYAECIPISTKRPVILPKDHAFSRLIVRHFHELYYHQNFEATVCAIRYKFWILNVRRLLKSVKGQCQVCKNLSATPEAPLMGQLPIDRLTPFVRPFSYTGVDYFGPVLVTIGRRKEKRWVAIFTCLTTRAIHLELAKDLSTDAVVIACRNFINRRGVPVRMRSDRGTNFVGASKENWVQTEQGISSECNRRGIEWIFNTPGNPSAGGIWERMVRTVKRVLLFTLKERAPQIETLQSLLIEAENLVNSRPLTHVPIESSDAEPLTPNHFILGCPNFVQTAAAPENVCLRKQWQIAQQLKQTFWKRWMLEYLPTLTRRTKWHKRVKPISVGDVVIVCDDNESRGQWKRGRVVEANPAADGQVRSVLVKTTTGNIRRPASKIAVLDVVGDSVEPDANHGGQDVTA